MVHKEPSDDNSNSEESLPPPSEDRVDKKVSAAANGKHVRWSAVVNDEEATTTAQYSAESSVARLPGVHQTDARVVEVAMPMEQTAIVMLEDDWELTWPIWHMLPRHERKELAQRHGYHTIGAFEEYMSLQKALDGNGDVTTNITNSGSSSSISSGARLGSGGIASLPYDNALAYPPSDKNITAVQSKGTEDDDDDDDSDTEDGEYNSSSNSETEDAETEDATKDELESDSLLLTFPDEILHNIFSFLPVTLYGTKLAYVSTHPHWRRVATSESAMKQICERVYLQQSKKKQLRVAKFHHSYRFMLYQRPRVQAGGGVYVLKFSRIKAIQRDMMTEIPPGAILETVYYRYLYFEENGSCLYALSIIPPHVMLRRFHRVMLQSSKEDPEALIAGAGSSSTSSGRKKRPKKLSKQEREMRAAELDTRVVWGTYSIQKDRVTVTAKQSWQTVQFVLQIATANNRPYEEHQYLHHHRHQNQQQPQHPAKAKTEPKTDANPDAKEESNPDGKLPPDTGEGSPNKEDDQYVDGTDPMATSPHGRFGVLQLEQHRTSVSGNFDENDTYVDAGGAAGGYHQQQVFHRSDVVNFTVEVNQIFRFLQDARF